MYSSGKDNVEFTNVLSYANPVHNIKCEFQEQSKPNIIVGNTRDVSKLVIRNSIQIKKETDDLDGKLLNTEIIHEECDLPSIKNEVNNDVYNNIDVTFQTSRANVIVGNTRDVSKLVIWNSIEIKKETNDIDGKLLNTEIVHEECDLPSLKNEVNNDDLYSNMDVTFQTSKAVSKKPLIKNYKYACMICGKRFSSLTSRRTHDAVHFRQLYIQCVFCVKVFLNPSQFWFHFGIYHLVKKPVNYKNSDRICFKEFTNKKNINVQVQHHTGEKLFKCGICLKEFTHKTDLKCHMRIHTGEKQFKCKICFKEYTQKTGLNMHMRVHTGEKPFKCEICLKGFTRQVVLKVHMRIHTGEKPFKCKMCFKQFTRNDVLDVHIRTHTGEKPFKCGVCFKYFAQKSNLNVHMQLHTGEKPFKCGICFKDFTQKSNLNVHMRLHAAGKL